MGCYIQTARIVAGPTEDALVVIIMTGDGRRRIDDVRMTSFAIARSCCTVSIVALDALVVNVRSAQLREYVLRNALSTVALQAQFGG